MRITPFIFAFLITSVNALAQDSTNVKYSIASDGSEYIIYPAVNGVKVMAGNFIEMNTVAKYNDSLLNSSIENGMPQYALYDTANFPAPFKEVFKNIHQGDSIVIKISTDSIILKSQGQAPEFMKKGQQIYQSFTIANVYTSKEQVDSAQKIYIPAAKERIHKRQLAMIEQTLKNNAAQIAADSKVIEAYLAKNKIKAIKANWGTYIAVKKEGTGKTITTDDVVAVNYTGKPLGSTKVFDSNTDPKFKHVEPYDVNMGSLSSLILGWFDALFQMKKGTVATVYIPSSLAYGKEGRMPEIAPDAILVFDMAVVNVRTEAEAIANQEAKEQKAQTEVNKPVKPIKKTTAPKKKPVTTKPKPKTKTAGK